MDAFLDMGWFCVLRIGVSDLHHGGGAVGVDLGGAVALAKAGVAAENVGAAVLTAENGPFGENGQTSDGGAAAISGGSVCQNAVVESDVDAVVMAIKSHGFHFNGGIQKFGAAHLCAAGGIQHRLGTGG